MGDIAPLAARLPPTTHITINIDINMNIYTNINGDIALLDIAAAIHHPHILSGVCQKGQDHTN